MIDYPPIDPSIPPSGSGCVECLATEDGWGSTCADASTAHIGCCDQSPSQHTSKHAAAEHHWMIRSFEPGEDRFYDYEQDEERRRPRAG